MLRLGKERNRVDVISDQIGSPTFAGDLSLTILKMIPEIENENVEIYHYSNEGVCSWYDFAKTIFSLKDISVNLNPIKSFEFHESVKRPLNSVMDKTKIKETFDIQIPEWYDSLKKFLRF